MAARTGAERYFEKQRENPEYERAYQEAAATVRAIDELVRSIDARREERGLSKAELAAQGRPATRGRSPPLHDALTESDCDDACRAGPSP